MPLTVSLLLVDQSHHDESPHEVIKKLEVTLLPSGS